MSRVKRFGKEGYKRIHYLFRRKQWGFYGIKGSPVRYQVCAFTPGPRSNAACYNLDTISQMPYHRRYQRAVIAHLTIHPNRIHRYAHPRLLKQPRIPTSSQHTSRPLVPQAPPSVPRNPPQPLPRSAGLRAGRPGVPHLAKTPCCCSSASAPAPETLCIRSRTCIRQASSSWEKRHGRRGGGRRGRKRGEGRRVAGAGGLSEERGDGLDE